MRYVLIMLLALFTLGVCTIFIFNVLVNTGRIYPANYAERKINEAYDLIQEADEVTEDMIPPLCRYVIFSLEGEKLKGNMSEDSLEIAWNAANQGAVSGRYFYKVIYRPKEYVVLQYRLTPMYRSAFLREHFIEPQNLMTIMVSYCGVKEIDDCLLSINEMRIALKDSLERQWQTEQDKNRQMSALAHDIKTPLTVVRGNAELLSETDLTEEQKNYMEYVISSASQIQNYVQTLIEVTQSVDGYQYNVKKVRTADLLEDIRKQTLGLAEVYRLKINWKEKWDSKTVYIVYDQIVRAVMNIIINAAEYTVEGGTIHISMEEQDGKLTFTVEDMGSGFTKEALLHGTEQFFMDDASRSGGRHYGIGLFSAETIAKWHGGRVLLANSEETGGAKVEIFFCCQKGVLRI